MKKYAWIASTLSAAFLFSAAIVSAEEVPVTVSDNQLIQIRLPGTEWEQLETYDYSKIIFSDGQNDICIDLYSPDAEIFYRLPDEDCETIYSTSYMTTDFVVFSQGLCYEADEEIFKKICESMGTIRIDREIAKEIAAELSGEANDWGYWEPDVIVYGENGQAYELYDNGDGTATDVYGNPYQYAGDAGWIDYYGNHYYEGAYRDDYERNDYTEIANPWSDCATLAEAEEIAGFRFQFGEAVDAGTFHAKTFRAMDGMIDVGYAAEGEEGCSLTIRQAPKTIYDISGDETQYSHDFTVSDAGVEDIRCRGSRDNLMVCSFDFHDSSFVIYPDGLTYNEVFYVIGEMTGVDPEIYTENPAEEPLEGAPFVSDNRLIDEEPIEGLAIAGSYSGINLGTCRISMYTSPDDEYAAVGTVEITDKDENLLYEGEIICVMDNFYELMGSEDVNFTVYSDNGNYGIDLYIDREHADYFVMFEHYES